MEQAFKSRKIKNLDKNDYHLQYIRDDKSYLDTVYCFTSLAGKTIYQPDHVKVTIHGKGGNPISIEKATDVPVAVSKDSISKTLDCPFIYINFEPGDSNLLIQDYLCHSAIGGVFLRPQHRNWQSTVVDCMAQGVDVNMANAAVSGNGLCFRYGAGLEGPQLERC